MEFVWVFLLRLRLAIRWVAFLQKAQNDRVTCKIPCHTEALAEVSINLKCILKFFGFFALWRSIEMEFSVYFSPFYKRLKMTKQATNPLLYCLICCHTERSEVSTKFKV